MAKFRITDNISGKTLVISGDKAPTEQEAEELFQGSGIRNQEQDQPQPQQGVLPQVANFLMPNVVKYAQNSLQEIGAGNIQPGAVGNQTRVMPQASPQQQGMDVLMSVLGPGAQQVAGFAGVGSPLENQKNMGARELAQTLELVKGVASGVQGGINALKPSIQAKSIVPSRVATNVRNTSAVQDTSSFSGKEISEAFTKAANDAPGGIRKKAMEFAAQDAERLKGANLTTKELVEEISKQWNASHTQKGVEMTKAQAQYALQARDELMKLLKARAPEIADQTRKIGKLIGGQESFMKLMKIIVPTAVVGGAIRGIGQ